MTFRDIQDATFVAFWECKREGRAFSFVTYAQHVAMLADQE